MEELMAAGARDVFYTPVYMKKNRPGWLLTVLSTKDTEEKLEEIIFRDTTTIGIRKQWMERGVLPRKFEQVKTPYGEVTVKICTYKDLIKVYPEYESVVKLAKEKNLPFETVFRSATECYGK